MKEGTLKDLLRGADDLVASARQRLLLYDMTPAQIQRLEQTGEASRTVTLYAPLTGHVIARKVSHGERIEPDTSLLDIADLSRIWVIASIYEYELPFVRVGQRAAMTLAYVPGKTYRGRVALIYPVLDETTRTAQVRLEFDNPDLSLKPEMYAHVELESDLGEGRIKEIADAIAPKLGLDRRQFLRTGCGMAAAFLAMNDAFGPLFAVDRAEAAADPRRGQRQ